MPATTPTEVTVRGVTYRLEKMDARTQWHVVRRIAPLVYASLPVIVGAMRAESAESALGVATETMKPLVDALSGLSDEDSNYVLDTCLATVRRPNGMGQYVSAFLRGGLAQFEEDGDMVVQLTLTAHVIWSGLSGFFSDVRGMFPAASTDPTSPSSGLPTA